MHLLESAQMSLVMSKRYFGLWKSSEEKKMKILFLTLLDIENLNEHGIYHDLLREFVKTDMRSQLLLQ